MTPALGDRCKDCGHPWEWHRRWLRSGGHQTEFGYCSCNEFKSSRPAPQDEYDHLRESALEEQRGPAMVCSDCWYTVRPTEYEPDYMDRMGYCELCGQEDVTVHRVSWAEIDAIKAKS